MSKPTWSEHDALAFLAAIPIEPIVLTTEKQVVAFNMGWGTRTLGKAWIEGDMVRHSVSEWDHPVSRPMYVYYPPSAFPVLAARFALEHRAHSPKEPT